MNSAGLSRSSPSIAIAGAGIIGLSAAWRIAQLGWHVTIFDKGFVGAEASWAGAGMLAPGGEVDEPCELTSLAINSRELYPSFVRELRHAAGLAIDYQECGALDLAFSDQELHTLTSRASRQAELGIESKPLTTHSIKTFWPRVQTERLAGARFYPGDAIVNPRDVVLALASACRDLGVSFVQNCAVTSAQIDTHAVLVHAGNGTSVYDAFLIAAGAWSHSIQMTGVPKLPCSEPVKGHLIGYQQPLQTCSTIIRHGHTYMLQRSSGLLLCGSSTERVGFDRTIDPAVCNSLAENAASLFPHLAETTPSETWIGFRPASDALQVGPWHSSRLFLAYGHYRNGILLSPVTANRIAAQIQTHLGSL